ncbi:MAG: hypothetical protein COA73_15160 [Candidatus Hydrogenedentota bacterium]|nr:MAG: hypothetical protein COA73_15160 [Candidatus Hydrogenedentota bacterium]
MTTEMKQTAKLLFDTGIGWVNRRDAAEKLGVDAVDAVGALKNHMDDSDTDVQRCVVKALGKVRGALEEVTIPPPTVSGAATLEKLVTALERPGKREVTSIENGYEIVVTINSGRKQAIRVTTDTSRLEKEIVRVYSICGEATEDVYRWCLKSNLQFTHCALAIEKVDEKDMLVLVNCFLAQEITYNALKVSVKEVAYYGDWVESKLTDEDIH